jgi:hypothetical protein
VFSGEVEPDRALLDTYKAGLPPGNYFDVATELGDICQFAWLGYGCSRRDVPKNA